MLTSSSDLDNASAEKLLPTDCEEDVYQSLPKRSRTRRYLVILKTIIIYSLAFWGLFNSLLEISSTSIIGSETTCPTTTSENPQVHTHHHTHNHDHDLEVSSQPNSPEEEDPCYCASSTAEALSKNCVFDSLSPAWVHPSCHDAALAAEFDALGDGPNGTWAYYADREYTHPLTISEVLDMADEDLDVEFHLKYEYHLVHCWLYWVKAYRARETGVLIEKRYDSEEHIRHCAKIFGNPVSFLQVFLWGHVENVC